MSDKLYSIGQAAKICDVSQRTLRYYEERGLIKPDHISDSRYRYYNSQTLRTVQVIRYYIEEGFSLDEAEEMIRLDDFSLFQERFRQHMERTRDEIRFYHQRLDSMAGWYRLIVEGKRALEHRDDSVYVKHFPSMTCFYIEEDVDLSDPNYDAKLEIQYFSGSKNDDHSMIDVGGAFLVHFDPLADRLDGSARRVQLMQEMYPHAISDHGTKEVKGFNGVCTYHIGPLRQVKETYQRAIRWAQAHDFVLQGDCYEQHLLDIYSTPDENKFVTRLILPVVDDYDDYYYLEEI